MTDQQIGRVLGIALRCRDKGKMTEVAEAEARVDGGLDGDLAVQAYRGVTLIAAGQWAEVQKELESDLPWYTRRANVLVDAERLGHLIGREITVGDVQLKIEGETKPCDLMDRLHHGLKAALKPECRGGVHGRVLQAGTIRVGDVVTCGTG
ncbi:MAG TPA: MOSC domain-containing protein [Phycisphaerae bacterium]|nr:MOSC domain-containing protein [Phycisphaerae bacterium]